MPFDEIGVLLTRWTIRLALALYAAVLLGRITVSGGRPRRWDRPLWTAACLIFLVHVACAFGFYHHWRHAEAMENVALQTKEMLGWEFGAGIYFSYAFALLWSADVLWMWIRPAGYANRRRWLGLGIQAYLCFIAFNGAVVFEGGPTRWGGLLASVVIFALLVWRLSAGKAGDLASIEDHAADLPPTISPR